MSAIKKVVDETARIILSYSLLFHYISFSGDFGLTKTQPPTEMTIMLKATIHNFMRNNASYFFFLKETELDRGRRPGADSLC